MWGGLAVWLPGPLLMRVVVGGVFAMIATAPAAYVNPRLTETPTEQTARPSPAVPPVSAPATTPPSGPTPDASAYLACRAYEQLAKEVNDGVLTDAELRTRFRDIYDYARISEYSPVVAASRDFLRQLTARESVEALQTAARSMNQACMNWQQWQ
jgi:hypothetical protein